jgi:outer membrane protein assembly factor BamB
MKCGNRVLRAAAIALAGLLAVNLVVAKAPKNGEDSILLVVMDPLARELACACVKGYGQRDYRKLAARLDSALKERVTIEFSDDLADSMASVSPLREVIVIGDRSLVAHGAKKGGWNCHAICELTDRDGNTTMTSSFIARADDSAKELKEVAKRKIFFGLVEGDEKYTASLAALRGVGGEPSTREKHLSYSDAALDLLDSNLSPLPIAVIPTYALRMLEGCGSVKPGNLRVIGRTRPVPFITVFVSDKMPAEKRENISKALLSIKDDERLLNAMESKDGFRAVKVEANDGSVQTAGDTDSKRSVEASESSWPDWRGSHRDGHVPRLPTRLPSVVKVVWKKGAVAGGLSGLSVSGGRLISAERDFADENDVYRCLNADSGELIWRQQFPARGKSLDYGQSPRATPVIHDGRVYLLGAFGDLRCVNFADGKVIWERHLLSEFHAELPTWGMCSTPLIVDDLLIVNPGSTNASLAALDCESGVSRWTTSGWPAAYSAFVCANLGARMQIVGYDQRSLGGWDVQSGRRLWELTPPGGRDFNVHTPIAFDGSVVVATENNGTRLYHFDQFGQIDCKPHAAFADLAPETISPVSIQGRLFGIANHRLYCLDLKQGLRPVWSHEEKALGDHASLIADGERLLVTTLSGELILLDARADTYAVLSRMRLFEDDVEVYSHPALVGTRLYVRGGSSIVSVELGLD